MTEKMSRKFDVCISSQKTDIPDFLVHTIIFQIYNLDEYDIENKNGNVNNVCVILKQCSKYRSSIII